MKKLTKLLNELYSLHFLNALHEKTQIMLNHVDAGTLTYDGKFSYRHGLCSNLDLYEEFTHLVFPFWPNFSGDCTYPVKGVGKRTAKEMYQNTINEPDDYLYRGTYGKRRINLLIWLDAELATAIKQRGKNQHEKINQGTVSS